MQTAVYSPPPLLPVVRCAPNVGFVVAGRHVAERQPQNRVALAQLRCRFRPGEGDKLPSERHLRDSAPRPCESQAPLGTSFAPAAATTSNCSISEPYRHP